MIATNQKRFERLVSTMDMPDFRKKATAENARWFIRNGGIQNRHHRNFFEVLAIAQSFI